MSSYNTLKSQVAAVVRTNGQNAITGENMQQTLNRIIDSFGGYWLFGGFAFRGNSPGQNIDQNVAWIALEPGIYSNFGEVEVHQNHIGVIYYDGGNFALYEQEVPYIPPIVNINQIRNEGTTAYSPQTARNYVPGTAMRLGVIIVYLSEKTSTKWTWTVEQYTKQNNQTWANDQNWTKLYPTESGGGGGGGGGETPYCQNLLTILNSGSEKLIFSKTSTDHFSLFIPANTQFQAMGHFFLDSGNSKTLLCETDLGSYYMYLYWDETNEQLKFKNYADALSDMASSVIECYVIGAFMKNGSSTLADSLYIKSGF